MKNYNRVSRLFGVHGFFSFVALLVDYYVAMTLTALDLISFKWQKFPNLRAWMNAVRKKGDLAWGTVCKRHDMQVMQRASRRASLY